MKDECNDQIKRIFVSHCREDLIPVEQFVDTLIDIGVKKGDIFYSSRTHMSAGIGSDFHSAIKESLYDAEIVFLMLSKNYYNSSYCLQEAGAAWILDKKLIPILMGITYDKMEGFIDKRILSVDAKENQFKDVLNHLKERGFIEDIPKNLEIFHDFAEKVKSSSVYIPNYVVEQNKIRETMHKGTLTKGEIVLLYYFLSNEVKYIYYLAHFNLLYRSILDFSKDYLKFDYEVSINLMNDRGWLSKEIEAESNKELYCLKHELFIDLISLDSVTKDEIYKNVNSRMIPDRKRTLNDRFLNDELSHSQMMLLNYIECTKEVTFGVRWMANEQIEKIKEWENKVPVSNILSSDYEGALNFLKEHGYVDVLEVTAYENPRKLILNDRFKKEFSEMSKEAKDIYNDAIVDYIELDSSIYENYYEDR